jgi:hypothetical protein
MPFTEIVIPSFKQDSDSKEAMQKIWPAASSVFHRTPAILSGHVGYIFLDNGSNVRADLTRMSLFGKSNFRDRCKSTRLTNSHQNGRTSMASKLSLHPKSSRRSSAKSDHFFLNPQDRSFSRRISRCDILHRHRPRRSSGFERIPISLEMVHGES